MKLSSIRKQHVLKAAEYIDHHGVPTNYLFNNYWIVVNGSQYPFKYLTRMAYQMVKGQKGDWLDFKSTEGYRNYIQGLGFEMVFHKEQLSPISKKELEFYATVAQTKYRKTDEEAVRKGEKLKTLVRKVNLWAELSLVDGFMFEKDHHWQWSGTFKSYIWIRVRRPNSSGLVYFKVSCEENGDLAVEIDCQYSNHSEGSKSILPKETVKAVYDYLNASDFRRLTITKEQVDSLNWDTLIDRTQSYITEFTPLYDELEALISQGETPDQSAPEGLLLQEAPSGTKSYALNKKSFQGVRINWERRLSGSKGLGDAGEELVKAHEVAKLKKLKFFDLAEQVVKRMDGEGYDIRSYNEKGDEIHIEVKTTVRGIDEPFYMSLNERTFLENSPENYFLYRLYDYRFSSKSAFFYILEGRKLLDVTFTPTNYEVSIKKTE